MKSRNKVLIVLLTAFIASAAFIQKASGQQPNVSFQVFYDELSPFGEWVNYPNWGYVWIPDAGNDFVPYSTDGHWILSDYGWTWLSDYSWGWAPFHYGRWDFDHYYGWFWIPGNEWGPAWVSWRRAEGYYGWAPMEPGISLSASFGRGYDSHNDHWIFVKEHDIDRSDINNYYVNRVDKDRIVRRSSVINNTYTDSRRHTTYIAGPARADVQKAAGRQVKPVAIQEYSKPGQEISNGNFRIYRPVVVNNNNREAKPAPARVANLKDLKQPSERNPINPDRRITNVNSPQPKIYAPAHNVTNDRQPNNIKSQSSNPPQNTRRFVQPDNNKSQNINPPQNLNREAAPVKSQSPPPVQNIRREQQQNNVKEQKIIPEQNNGRRQESTTTGSSGEKNRGQENKSNGDKAIKEHKENNENK